MLKEAHYVCITGAHKNLYMLLVCVNTGIIK